MDAVDNSGLTPLHLAIRENNEPEIIQFLLEKEASVCIPYNECNTVLHSIRDRRKQQR
jgi:ankyrin repeat protein